jgi:hypothetical protein
MEGDDDRCLDGFGRKLRIPRCGHAVEQRLAVVGVALMAGRQAAFFVVLQQRFVQGGDHMGGRGKAPLPGFGHVGVLIVQIHGQ